MIITTSIESIKRRRIIENAISDVIERNEVRYKEVSKYYGGSLEQNEMGGINSFTLDTALQIEDNIITRGINPHRDIMHKNMGTITKPRIFR